MHLLEFEQVKKSYKDKTVLKDISFHVEPSESVALIGSNGAGKTTIIKSILNLIDIDEGNIMRNFNVKHDVAVMLQNNYFPDHLRVREVIELHKSYYKSDIDVEHILKQVELVKEAKSNVEHLSGGQQRRLSFAMALASNPEILFLDEPTVGMDTEYCLKFWKIVNEFTANHKTVFVTSHNLDELNDYCNRFIFIQNGSIVEDVTKSELNKEKMLVVVDENEEKLKYLQENYGGTIIEHKLFLTEMERHKELMEELEKEDLNYEYRFKEVKDLYREINIVS
ncbi:ABC transporter ATP-binding protein [Sediminibacillus sp. JSM 1682029]|uniref:ABC transporter ATP-binding protein n=1 Tax=Sediminibacillus sp. JSM 1682029 TaxID=3229857 RepID=UPI0035246ACF